MNVADFGFIPVKLQDIIVYLCYSFSKFSSIQIIKPRFVTFCLLPVIKSKIMRFIGMNL